MKCTVYVDGFNLYNRCLKNRPHAKWLNLEKLAKHYTCKDVTEVKVRYFAARLINSKFDKSIAQRQSAYLRALKTIKGLSLHMGQFKKRILKALRAERINQNDFKVTDDFIYVVNWPILPKKISPSTWRFCFFRAFIMHSVVVLTPFRFVSIS